MINHLSAVSPKGRTPNTASPPIPILLHWLQRDLCQTARHIEAHAAFNADWLQGDLLVAFAP